MIHRTALLESCAYRVTKGISPTRSNWYSIGVISVCANVAVRWCESRYVTTPPIAIKQRDGPRSRPTEATRQRSIFQDRLPLPNARWSGLPSRQQCRMGRSSRVLESNLGSSCCNSVSSGQPLAGRKSTRDSPQKLNVSSHSVTLTAVNVPRANRWESTFVRI